MSVPGAAQKLQRAEPNLYRAVATRLEVFGAAYASNANQLSQVTRIFWVSPDFEIYDLVAAFPNWWVSGYGIPLPEADCKNPCSVGASLEIGGERYPFLFGGRNSVESKMVLAPGTTALTDPLRAKGGGLLRIPARTRCYFLTERLVASPSDEQIGGYRQQTQNGEASQYSSGDQSELLLSGKITGNANNNYGPCAAVAKGWDGRPVICCVGDSIGVGAAESARDADMRGMTGYVKRGLDDDGNGTQRLPALSLMMNGTRQQNSSRRSSGEFRRRAELLDLLAGLNPQSKPVFTHWLSQMGVNGAGGTYDKFQRSMDVFYQFIHSLANLPIVQCTLTPRTRDNSRTFYSDLAHQVELAPFPAADRFQFNAEIMTPAGRNRFGIAAVIEAHAVMGDTAMPGRFAVSPFEATLSAEALPGANALTLDHKPDLGALLVLEPNSGNAELTAVSAVSGTGPYAVTVSRMQRPHAIGATAKETLTPDGLHPSSRLHRRAIAVVQKAKKEGAFT